METIDRKFVILAVNPCKKGTRFLILAIKLLQRIATWFNLNANTDKNGFFFKAADEYAPDALTGYINAMEKGQYGKVEDAQISSAKLLRQRVANYHVVHGHRIPDIEGYCETDRCIGGIGL